MNNKIKVMHLADYNGPYRGNFINSLEMIATALDNRQILVFDGSAMLKSWYSELFNHNIIYHISSRVGIFHKAIAIYRLCQRERVTIIHCHFSTYDIAAVIAAFYLRIFGRRVKVIWHVHSTFTTKSSAKSRIKNFIRWRIFGKFALLIFVSEGAFETMIPRGILKNNSRIVLNGIKINNIKEHTGSSFIHRNNNQFTFAAFGWSPLDKGIDLLLDVCEQLHFSNANFLLKLYGQDKLIEFIHERYGNTLPEWLDILEPVLNAEEIYVDIDVFVSASRLEGFSYAIAEAMYNNCLVISSDIAGVSWSKPSQAPLFFESGNSTDLLRLMQQSMEMDLNSRALRLDKGRKFIETNVSLEKWAREIIDIYFEKV